jgi:galactokinase/mevalonate kinase-like predicted kinase
MTTICATVLEWHTVETYRWCGLHGLGVSASSNRSLLEAAGQFYLAHGLPPILDQVVARALQSERALAGGHAIAAQDVAAIAYGGAQEIHTSASGAVGHRRIACNAEWLRDHVIFAYNPSGQRHDAPGLLEALFAHPQARGYVARISALALEASDALQRCDLGRLARAIRPYVTTFSAWAGGRLVNDETARITAGLGDALDRNGRGLLAWKFLGAGAASSLIALVGDGSHQAASDHLEGEGWVVVPVRLAGGLDWQESGPGEVRFVAGHRIDLVGAADLGQDRAIGVDGVCVALAIEPLSELTIRRPGPGLAPSPGESADPWAMSQGGGI